MLVYMSADPMNTSNRFGPATEQVEDLLGRVKVAGHGQLQAIQDASYAAYVAAADATIRAAMNAAHDSAAADANIRVAAREATYETAHDAIRLAVHAVQIEGAETLDLDRDSADLDPFATYDAARPIVHVTYPGHAAMAVLTAARETAHCAYCTHDAAYDAIYGATYALAVRHLIGRYGFMQEHYDRLTAPVAGVLGRLHPDDEERSS
jgi:hypothetical protein